MQGGLSANPQIGLTFYGLLSVTCKLSLFAGLWTILIALLVDSCGCILCELIIEFFVCVFSGTLPTYVFGVGEKLHIIPVLTSPLTRRVIEQKRMWPVMHMCSPCYLR